MRRKSSTLPAWEESFQRNMAKVRAYNRLAKAYNRESRAILKKMAKERKEVAQRSEGQSNDQ
jgi:hypothetical protein